MSNALKILSVYFCAALSAFAAQKRVVFVSGNSVHLWGDHEHAIMCGMLRDMVAEAMGASVKAEWLDLENGGDINSLKGADAVILITEGENNHPFDSKMDFLKSLNDAGTNIGAFHYALMFNKPEDNKVLDSLIGGHYQKGFSFNPFYEARFDFEGGLPTLRGVRPFGYYDEWHFNIMFNGDPAQKRIDVLKTRVPAKIRKRRSAPEAVRAAGDRLETIAWLVENPNGTRGFGIMGGHVPWTLANKDYRKFVLNSVAWLAGVEIPPQGFDAQVPEFDSITAKIKKQKRADYEYYYADWKKLYNLWRAEK